MGCRNAAAWLGSCLQTPGEDQGITSLHLSIHITLSILATTSRDQGAMTSPRLRGVTAPKYKLSHTYNEPHQCYAGKLTRIFAGGLRLLGGEMRHGAGAWETVAELSREKRGDPHPA